MNPPLVTAFVELRHEIATAMPAAADELRPPVPYSAEFLDRPGAAQLSELWSVTSGQAESTLGIVGGLSLLGPVESQLARDSWQPLLTSGSAIDAVAHPSWDTSRSLDPDAVRAVYFAAGWIPILREPLEGNYLAVDLVPLPQGQPGQIVLCGRDEDDKCLVSSDLATLFHALAVECRSGAWELRESTSRKGVPFRYVERRGGRLLAACKRRQFPPRPQ